MSYLKYCILFLVVAGLVVASRMDWKESKPLEAPVTNAQAHAPAQATAHTTLPSSMLNVHNEKVHKEQVHATSGGILNIHSEHKVHKEHAHATSTGILSIHSHAKIHNHKVHATSSGILNIHDAKNETSIMHVHEGMKVHA